MKLPKARASPIIFPASWLVWLDADALLLDFETELRQIVAKAEKGCDVPLGEKWVRAALRKP